MALILRKAWLGLMGLSEDEIEADIRGAPLDLQEELENMKAWIGVQELNKLHLEIKADSCRV